MSTAPAQGGKRTAGATEAGPGGLAPEGFQLCRPRLDSLGLGVRPWKAESCCGETDAPDTRDCQHGVINEGDGYCPPAGAEQATAACGLCLAPQMAVLREVPFQQGCP